MKSIVYFALAIFALTIMSGCQSSLTGATSYSGDIGINSRNGEKRAVRSSRQFTPRQRRKARKRAQTILNERASLIVPVNERTYYVPKRRLNHVFSNERASLSKWAIFKPASEIAANRKARAEPGRSVRKKQRTVRRTVARKSIFKGARVAKRKRVKRSRVASKRSPRKVSKRKLSKKQIRTARKSRKVSRKKRVARRSKGKRGRYRALIAKHARANGVPLRLAMAVVQIESGGRAKARGRAGEIGLMQIMPRTARGIGYRGKMKHLYNPNTNLRYGMKYLGKAYRLGGRTPCGAVLKYNAGHGAKRWNPISRRYCSKVKRIMRRG